MHIPFPFALTISTGSRLKVLLERDGPVLRVLEGSKGRKTKK